MSINVPVLMHIYTDTPNIHILYIFRGLYECTNVSISMNVYSPFHFPKRFFSVSHPLSQAVIVSSKSLSALWRFLRHWCISFLRHWNVRSQCFTPVHKIGRPITRHAGIVSSAVFVSQQSQATSDRAAPRRPTVRDSHVKTTSAPPPCHVRRNNFCLTWLHCRSLDVGASRQPYSVREANDHFNCAHGIFVQSTVSTTELQPRRSDAQVGSASWMFKNDWYRNCKWP